MDTTPKSCKNKHLNAFECYKLEVLLKAKVSVLETAKYYAGIKARYTKKLIKVQWSFAKVIRV